MVVKLLCDICNRPLKSCQVEDQDVIGVVELGKLEVRIDVWGVDCLHTDHDYRHLCPTCYAKIDNAITSLIVKIKAGLVE